MKKDLGKPYGGEPAALNKSSDKPEKFYPSTTLESDSAMDIPSSMLNKDIEVKVTIRICRTSKTADKKGIKQSLEIEFRKIDFGNQVKDQDVQDDISDALEGLQESQEDESGED